MARIQELKLAGGNRALLVLALLAGLVAAAIVFVVVSEGGDDGGTTAVGGGDATVVVASQNIAAGAEITAEMVKTISVSDDLVVSGAATETTAVVGESTLVAIAVNEQVTTAKLGLPVPDDGLSGVVPAGMRGVAVAVDEVTAVGGLLFPGDRVDIVAVTRIDGAPGLSDEQYILRTATILQNVEVLSVAQEAQEAAAQPDDTDADTTDATYTSGQVPEDPDQQPDAATITVSLNPEQTQLLISEQEHAIRVWAVLRPYGAQETTQVQPLEIIITEN